MSIWVLTETRVSPAKNLCDNMVCFVLGGGVSVKDERHVFISYQWDSKPIIMKLVNSLKVEGYRVWVDFDKMCM